MYTPFDRPPFTNSKLPHGRRCALNACLAFVRCEGATAELGVWAGGASRHIALRFPERTHYAIDTFDGIPNGDEEHGDAHLKGTLVGDYPGSMERLNLPNVRILKGYFPHEVCPPDDERFAFVHLDADTYESTRDALAYFLPRMNAGGIVLLDDYGGPNTPGVKAACDEAGIQPTGLEAFQAVWMQ
jgi:O-methyltransferase